MTLRPPLFFACAALVLAASCSRDDPDPPPVQEASGAPAAAAPEPPRLTPAESAAAVARHRAAADAKTREVRAGIDALEPPPPDPPHVETNETIYQSCLAQSRSADEPLRSQLREICERRRNGP